jgi:hypothetical protein
VKFVRGDRGCEQGTVHGHTEEMML